MGYIRSKFNNLNPTDPDLVQKMQSLLKENLNFYELVSYAIINNLVSEKDGFKLFWKDVKNAYTKCRKNKVDISQHKSFIELYLRWNQWGISKHYTRLILNVGIWSIVFLLSFYTINYLF